MFTPEFWSRLDAAVGVPVELAVSQDVTVSQCMKARDECTSTEYLVTTKAPLIYARRNHVTSDDALSRIEGAGRQTFAEVGVVLTEGAVRAHDSETLAINVSDGALWHSPFMPFLDVLTARAHAIRASEPAVMVAKQCVTWREFTEEVGEDAAVWAALNAANAKPPFTIPGDLKTLASRHDENPLALIRRAYAASVIRLDVCSDDSRPATNDPEKAGETDTYLRATLVWVNRVSYDTKRHQRTRPLTLALEKVAQAVIRHLEQTPVTRTDSLALEAARTLFAKSLACVNLAAPVPA